MPLEPGAREEVAALVLLVSRMVQGGMEELAGAAAESSMPGALRLQRCGTRWLRAIPSEHAAYAGWAAQLAAPVPTELAPTSLAHSLRKGTTSLERWMEAAASRRVSTATSLAQLLTR